MSDKSIPNSGSSPSANYEVGYKKPSILTRFKPGISGNPKGRPKKKDNELINERRPHVAKARPKKIRKEPIIPVLREITHQEISEAVVNLSLEELRRRWEKAWSLKAHKHLGRKMLEKSLIFKVKELNGLGLTRLQREKLDQLVKMYKRNPKCFDDRIGLKAGVRLVRTWKGERINVLVKENGFEYNGTLYKSLSAVANVITGIKWNGWQFFGLKGKKPRW